MQVNKSLKILFLLNSIFVFGGSLFGPLYAIYAQEIDNKITAVSLSWAVFMISSILFTYFVSRWGDLLKEQEYLLAVGYFVRALGWFSYLFVNNFTGLLLVQITLGLGEAFGTPSWNAIFAKHLDNHKEISEYSKWGMINNLVVAIATVLGGFLVSYFGFKVLFLAMSLLAMISFIGTLMTPRRIL